jgi:hypothetical protein
MLPAHRKVTRESDFAVAHLIFPPRVIDSAGRSDTLAIRTVDPRHDLPAFVLAAGVAIGFGAVLGDAPRRIVAAEIAAAEIAAAETPAAVPASASRSDLGASTAFEAAISHAAERLQGDVDVVRRYRPAYPFWQHIFTIPDGRIVFGSGRDGHLIANFPAKGNWLREAQWFEPDLAPLIDGVTLPVRLDDKRDLVARLLEPAAGPVLHNPTRGEFLLPNIPRYGPFLDEWALIYERFGVPAEIGLAQAILESGLNGTARSRANALGLCQFLKRNWQHLNKLAPEVIEAYNQTTQAPYCAAYLSILSTMYGSFIPALSEHHAGGVNVGRAMINGERLGATTPREQYLLGSQFARDLRSVSLQRYRDLYGTYGVRSFRYAEMVFGNVVTVERIRGEVKQERVFAMRTTRAITLAEITRRTKLSADEIRRFNPALTKQVPAGSNLYLPAHVPEFGRDVTFWHQPASPEFTSTLDEFVRLTGGVERWHEASFEAVLQDFKRRFEATASDEGTVMAAALAYVIGDLRTSRRAAILEDFRTNGRIIELFQQGVAELSAMSASDQQR